MQKYVKRNLVSLLLGFGLFVVLSVVVSFFVLFAYGLMAYPQHMSIALAGAVLALILFGAVFLIMFLMMECGKQMLQKISNL